MGCFFPQKFYCKFLFCKKVKQKYYKNIDRFRAKIQGDSEMGLVCLPWCSDLNGSDFLNTNNTKIYINKPNLCYGNNTMYKEFYLQYRCDTDHICFNSYISQFRGVSRRTLILPSVHINIMRERDSEKMLPR